jgi:hypothetical protein
MALGWAGLIDGIEGFCSAVMGPFESSKDERLWKYLKAFNLVGAGGAGIDAVGTMIHVIFSKDLDMKRMDRLVERMRDSPVQIFLEIGENLEGALTELSSMPENEFNRVVTVGNIVNWIKYEFTGKLPGDV